MTGSHDRREFLRRLAGAAAYAAPVVATFRAAAAQDVPGMSSQMNPNDGGHGDPMAAATFEPSGPWDNPPPGRTEPPTPIP